MHSNEVASVERLCDQLYNGSDNVQRKAAEAHLATFTTVGNLPQILSLIEKSLMPVTLFFVSSALRRVIEASRDELTASQLISIIDQVMQLFVLKGPQLELQVAKSFSLLLAQVTKLGWLLGEAHQQLPARVLATLLVPQPTLALQICTQVVLEAGHRGIERSLEDHKVILAAVRDGFLPVLFRVSVECVASTRQAPVAQLWSQALAAIEACLAYDFTCAMPDEALDGAETIYPPDSWRPMLQPPALTLLLWEVYELVSGSPQGTAALRCLSLAMSLPRAFFESPEARLQWLDMQLQCTARVMQDRRGLQSLDAHLEFCRGLARLKANASLSQLVTCPQYPQWAAACAAFTESAFSRWDADPLHLLTLWVSLCVSISMLRAGEPPSGLEEFVPRVAIAYINSRMELARQMVENKDEDDQLGDTGEQCALQLQPLSKLITPFYAQVGQVLAGHLQATVNQLQNAKALDHTQLATAECRMTWLVYIIGAILAGHCGDFGEQCEAFDAQLVAAVLRLLPVVQERCALPGAAGDDSLRRLERSLLFWMRELRRTHMAPDEVDENRTLVKVQQLMGLDHVQAIGRIFVTKVVVNLQTWNQDENLFIDTLQLTQDLSQDRLLQAELLRTDLVQALLGQRHRCPPPLLTSPQLLKARRRFFRTLGNLLTLAGPSPQTLSAFLAPQESQLTELCHADAGALASPAALQAVAGLASDLLGVCEACESEKWYGLLLQWLVPARLAPLLGCLEALPAGAEAGPRLLKCLAELLHNRRARIPRGCPLATQCAGRCLFVACKSQLTAPPPTGDPWKTCYRPKYLCLAMAAKVVAGRYVDITSDAMTPLLGDVLRVMASVSPEDILAYPKLSKTFFNLLADLFESQCPALQRLEGPAFHQLCEALVAAVRHSHINRRMTNRALAAVDRLASHPEQYASQLAGQDVLARLAGMVFSLCLLDARWNASPVLPLCLLFKEQFLRHFEAVCGRIASEVQRQRFHAAAVELLRRVPAGLDPAARETFARHLTAFRRAAAAAKPA